MKLIVGLGNPGREYQNTRHNMGFSLVDFYLSHKKIVEDWKKKFNGLYLKTTIQDEAVIFLKPQTYMNLSGEAVYQLMEYFHIDVDDVLIISDDLDLKIGNFKLRSGGSSGGHNGLKSIESHIGSSFKRLKIGISKNQDGNVKDYVLGGFSKEEKEILNTLYPTLCSVLDDYFTLSFDSLMNRYNQKNR